LAGRATQGDVARAGSWRAGTSVVAAYTLNELADSERGRLEDRLLDVSRHGGHVLILEPLARGVTPWWEATAERFAALGGRADEWRFAVAPPPLVAQLGEAAGLNCRELRLQSIFV
jgi:hypothetical protein